MDPAPDLQKHPTSQYSDLPLPVNRASRLASSLSYIPVVAAISLTSGWIFISLVVISVT